MARILIIDDNEDNLDLTSLLLSRRGHQTVMVNNGRAGVASATEQEFDLILVDLRMPGMDGFATAAAIRKLSWAENVTMLAMSAGDPVPESGPAVGGESPFDGFFSLPIEPELFAADVERFATKTHLSGRQMVAEGLADA